MPNESPHFGLNVETLRTATPEEISHHVVLFSREARNAPFAERVNPIAIPLTEFAKLVKPESDLSTDIATAKIYCWSENDIFTENTVQIWLNPPHPTMEEILLQMPSPQEYNPGSIMIWISPKGKDYQETRINVYQTIMVNGKKYLFFWGIPTDHSDEKCLEFAQKLSGYKFRDVEVLRINPIPLQIPETLTTFLQKNIELSEVWVAMADGSIIRKTVEELCQSQEILTDERYQRIMTARTFEEKVRIGKEIEWAIRTKFQIELLSHAHGGLYSDLAYNQSLRFGLLHLGAERFSASNTEITGERVHCGRCGKFRKGERMDPDFKCPESSSHD